MNDNDRLDHYLNARADLIDAGTADPARIALRADQRRRSRRVVGGLAATGVVAAGALVVALIPPATQDVGVGGSPGTTPTTSAAASPSGGPRLNWRLVDVPKGLGWSMETVAAADGSLYGLGTAPGPTKPSRTGNEPTVLYRSDDGQTWQPATLPTGFMPSGLATSGANLYAVGTAPAGGSVELVVATSADGAATWTEAHIEAPLAALRGRHPDEVKLTPPAVANGPAGLVAAVSVNAQPDVAKLFRAKGVAFDERSMWKSDDTGVYLMEVRSSTPVDPSGCPRPPATMIESANEGGTTSGSAPASAGSVVPSPVPTTTSPSSDSLDAEKRKLAMGACMGEPKVTASYTWAQLGLDPELQALMHGELHLYATNGSGQLAEVSAPVSGKGTSVMGLFGAADGYRLLVMDYEHDQLQLLGSSDGKTWRSTGTMDGAWIASSTVIDGKPAVLLNTKFGGKVLRASADLGWSTTDIAAELGTLQSGAIGPLGVVGVEADGEPAKDDPRTFSYRLVESADLLHVNRTSFASLGVPPGYNVLGITENADAVVVRLAPFDQGTADQAPILTQKLLVGTRA